MTPTKEMAGPRQNEAAHAENSSKLTIMLVRMRVSTQSSKGAACRNLAGVLRSVFAHAGYWEL